MIEHLKQQNFILQADAYKATHWKQLKISTNKSYSVIVPRKVSKYSDIIVAMGQSMVASYFASVRITDEMIDEAELEITEQGYDFYRAGWEYIAHELDGKLPLAIFGVEEGRIVQPQTPILGIINTDDRSAWLPAYSETIAQDIIWTMSSVASLSLAIRKTFAYYIEETGAHMNQLNTRCHFFGDRGGSSPESAVLTAIAHAAIFDGSDCLQANRYIKRLYNTSKAYTSSIDATEHSTMCDNSDATTKDDYGAAVMAVELLEQAVERTKTRGIGIPMISAVIDTYDSRRFVRDYVGGPELKERVINSGGTFVFRPDSGDITVEPGMVGNDIEYAFGVEVNEKGYKVIPCYTAVLQGDGIKWNTYESVIKGWVDAGFSIDNFAIGMGAGLSNGTSRDDFSFSMKSIATFDGLRWTRKLKEPKTDLGKKSLSGLVRCREDANGNLEVYDAIHEGNEYGFMYPGAGWKLWFENGHRKYRQSFDEVREWASK